MKNLTENQLHLISLVMTNPGGTKLDYVRHYVTRNGHSSSRYGYAALNRLMGRYITGTWSSKGWSLQVTDEGKQALEEFRA